MNNKRLNDLLLKRQKKNKEEKLTGIKFKGRKSMFEEGIYVGSLIRDWGGLKNIPQYIKDIFAKPKSKQGKIDFNLGVEYGKNE